MSNREDKTHVGCPVACTYTCTVCDDEDTAGTETLNKNSSLCVTALQQLWMQSVGICVYINVFNS